MDFNLIRKAYEGLQTTLNTFKSLSNLKIEAATISKISDAEKQVAEALDILYKMRDELFRLQDENNNLKKEIYKINDLSYKKQNYELYNTDGGAVVYKSKNEPLHYVCPNCFQRNEIQILQDRNVIGGVFDCPGCRNAFKIKKIDKSRFRK